MDAGYLGHAGAAPRHARQLVGVAGEQIYRRAGRISQSEVISGILGSLPDHHGALYALTEEFTAVYRMHPLIPDDYVFHAAPMAVRCTPAPSAR